MNYLDLKTFDCANGEGVRVSLWVSGCTMHCKGCFNPESHDFKAGQEFTEDTVQEIMEALEEPSIAGLSILGGDPIEPENINTVTDLCRRVKEKYPEKNIWLWTGRKYESIYLLDIMKYLDVLIDGPFIQHLKIDPTHQKEKAWFGSSNQRLIRLTHSA